MQENEKNEFKNQGNFICIISNTSSSSTLLRIALKSAQTLKAEAT